MAGIARIGPTIEAFLRRSGIGQRVKAELALQLWREVAGPDLASKTHAFAVRHGILFVGCASPALAHHLSFMKADYLAALARRIGPGIVTDIRFQTRDIAVEAEQASARQSEPVKEALNAVELAEIESQAQCVPRGELRETFLRASISARMVSKGRKKSGWTSCSRCRALIPPGGECTACSTRAADERCRMTRMFLHQHPWWTFGEMQREIPGLLADEFQKAKRELLGHWDREIQIAVREAARDRREEKRQSLRMAVMRYVMLALGHVPGKLDSGTVSQVLGKQVAAVLFREEARKND